MKYLKFYCLLSLLVFSQILEGQNNCNYVAGTCCGNAPIICDLTCLDGFEGTLFDTSSLMVKQNLICQPKAICTSGGRPNNMSWFAFVAGSNYSRISITHSNCTINAGIQVGIFGDCDFTDDLDLNGFPIASEYIDCEDPAPGTLNPVVVESSNFIQGQTYYFYVDGINSDVCKYKVKVDQAVQKTELPPLGVFDQDPLRDTIRLCPSTTYELGVESYNREIDYYWKVSPTNSFYPYSNFTKLNKDMIEFKFDSVSTYTVSLYGYNGCDYSDTISKTFIVRNYVNEKFKDVSLCENRFPFEGPKLEDPNADGLIGWLGPIISTAGKKIYNVTIAPGCSFTQELDVFSFPIKTPTDVTIVECQSFTYEGQTISQTSLDLKVNISSVNKLLCDSVVNLNAYVLDVKGSISPTSCDNGKVTVTFNSTNISSPPGYKISYIWKDQNGVVIPDNDADPRNIQIGVATTVTLMVELEVLGKKCSFGMNSLFVNPALQLPASPVISNWPLEVCQNNTASTFTLPSIAGVSYSWTVDNFAKLSSTSGNSVTIDFSKVPSDGKVSICVQAINGCGLSLQSCHEVTVLSVPNTSIQPSNLEVCKDSLITINLPKVSDFNYSWQLGPAKLKSGDINSLGPISLCYPKSGQFQLGLKTSNKFCEGNIAYFVVNVISSVAQTNITFEPSANDIKVKWEKVDCATSYNVFLDNVFIVNTKDIEYVFKNLNTSSNYEVKIEAIGNETCACGKSETVLKINTLDCNKYSLNIDDNNPTLICENDWAKVLNLNANFTEPSNTTFIWSGKGVDDKGNFSPETAGPGKHKVFVTSTFLGCNYIDSTEFNLIEKPKAGIKTNDPTCEDDETGSLTITPENASSIFNYILDGIAMNGNSSESVLIGKHNLEIIDGNNCKVEKTFEIMPPSIPNVVINTPDRPIFDNEEVKITISDNASLNLIDSIVWIINGEVVCSGKCNEVNFTSMEDGEYNHQVLIYYKDCFMEKSFAFLVNETPKVYISNIINPNSINPINKYFTITSNDSGFKIKEVSIYSKWGEKMFQKKDFVANEETQLWDGTFNGNSLMPGVFMLHLSYVNEKGVEVKLYKDLTIVR